VRSVVVTCAAVLVLTACSTGSPSGAGPSTRTTAPAARTTAPTTASTTGAPAEDRPPLGAPGCRPPSPIRPYPGGAADHTGAGGPEVQGTGHQIELWGLIFADRLRADREIKIVWRATGTGDLTVSLTDPDGRRRALAWGPTPHGGSTYDRPGEEWGTGLRFTAPGCWRLHARRGGGSADVWFRVPA
jgi:hypothetical protein